MIAVIARTVILRIYSLLVGRRRVTSQSRKLRITPRTKATKATKYHDQRIIQRKTRSTTFVTTSTACLNFLIILIRIIVTAVSTIPTIPTIIPVIWISGNVRFHHNVSVRGKVLLLQLPVITIVGFLCFTGIVRKGLSQFLTTVNVLPINNPHDDQP